MALVAVATEITQLGNLGSSPPRQPNRRTPCESVWSAGRGNPWHRDIRAFLGRLDPVFNGRGDERDHFVGDFLDALDRRKERLPEPRSSSSGVARRDLNQARRVRQTCFQGTGCATPGSSDTGPWFRRSLARTAGRGCFRRPKTGLRRGFAPFFDIRAHPLAERGYGLGRRRSESSESSVPSATHRRTPCESVFCRSRKSLA